MWEWIGLIGIVTIAVLLIVFRKNPYVKKYWKYALILIPAAIILILVIINKRQGDTGTGSTNPDPLGGAIQDIKDDLQEANLTAAVEVSAAKEKNKETLDKLAEIKNLDDKRERLKRLAELVG
jgi:glucan phosphoethanolaminetransferase (alkaline phosphatase superfamily)